MALWSRDLHAAFGLAIAAAFVAACAASAPEDPPGAAASADVNEEIRAVLGIPEHFAIPPYPDYNVPTEAKRELGRHLFYDRRLSGNGTQACESCHL
ncbi:MAG: cytochrome c peroxidase, partial [Myxococcota bacterium]